MHELNSDSPIEAPEEDVLGYWPFAQSVAKGMVRRGSKDGFVVGVQARWGMGKTSAINLIRRAIDDIEQDKSKQKKTKIQKFNPWLFAGLENLAKGYLSQLGRVIDDTLEQGTPPGTRQFVERLVRGGAEFIGGAAAIGAVAVTGGAAAPYAMPLKSAVSGALTLTAHTMDSRPLDAMIQELTKHLNDIDCRIIVIVDDLDRLAPDELRQILTLIKTFGNLPNITHLLAYDRGIVSSALERDAAGSAPDKLPSFLEKIVQVEFDLPYPGYVGLRRMLISRLVSIFGPSPEMDQEDWIRVMRVAFNHYIRSPRDVVRLTNALSVIWPSVEGEVYVPDLVALELMRHHESAVYDAIRQRRSFLTGSDFFSGRSEAQIGRKIADTVHEARREDTMGLLAQMFPAAAKHLQERHYGGGQRPKPLSGRRIGATDGFDAYFRFAPAADQVPVSQLREVARHLNDRNWLTSFFLDSMNRKRPDGTSFIAPLLQELSFMLEHMDATPELLRVLIDLGDEIIELRDPEQDFDMVDNKWRIGSVLEKAVRRFRDERRFSIVGPILDSATAGVGVTAYIIARLGQPYGLVWPKAGDDAEEPALTREEITEIGRKFAERLEMRAAGGELRTGLMIGVILRVWSTFGSESAARDWVAKMLSDPASFVDLAFSQMAEVTSSAPPYRFRSLRGEFREGGVLDLDAMLAAARQHLASGDIPERDRSDIERFIGEGQHLLEQRADRGDVREVDD